MNNSEQWISFKEHKPTEFPVLAFYPKDGHINTWYMNYVLDESDSASHWMPLKVVPPAPPRAKTLAEEDAEAFTQWNDRITFKAMREVSGIWHAALAYERAEISKLITNVRPNDYVSIFYAVLDKIKARVKGGAS